MFRINGAEYALARTEKKNGIGYRGFAVFTLPSVTIETDLSRKDLTINAMAIDMAIEAIVDPFGGVKDIRNKTMGKRAAMLCCSFCCCMRKEEKYMIRFERVTDQPILRPREDHEWERSAVFNAAAIYYKGLFHLLYRTTDNPPSAKYGMYISRIGYAVSSDGINFYREERPIFEGKHVQEQRGVEDPRVVKIGDMFYMTYTGFGGRFEGDYRIMIAYSQDLMHWERMGVVMDEPNKDAALFPEKIGGRYAMFHRRYPNIWIAFSEDLIHWTDHHEVIKTRPGTWESARVGIAGPPIKTDKGWLAIYHAADDNNVYRLGIALLDLNDPAKVLYRQPEPVLEPELPWEVEGYIPNVVFSCGQAEAGDDIWLYYGGADTVIGVAKTSKQKLKCA